MNILLIIFAILVALIMYILLMPLSLNLKFKYDKKTGAAVRVGLFPFRFQFNIGQPTKPKTVKEKAAKVKAEKVRVPKDKISFDDIKLLMRVMIQFIQFSLKLVRLPKYHCRLSIAGGIGAPDITGELYGLVQSVKPILPDSITLNYEPDFVIDGVTGDFECGLVVRPIMIINQFLRFIVELPFIKLYKIYKNLN